MSIHSYVTSQLWLSKQVLIVQFQLELCCSSVYKGKTKNIVHTLRCYLSAVAVKAGVDCSVSTRAVLQLCVRRQNKKQRPYLQGSANEVLAKHAEQTLWLSSYRHTVLVRQVPGRSVSHAVDLVVQPPVGSVLPFWQYPAVGLAIHCLRS